MRLGSLDARLDESRALVQILTLPLRSPLLTIRFNYAIHPCLSLGLSKLLLLLFGGDNFAGNDNDFYDKYEEDTEKEEE